MRKTRKAAAVLTAVAMAAVSADVYKRQMES